MATQDSDLRVYMRSVAGTPILLINRNVLTLEPPSQASKEQHTKVREAKGGMRERATTTVVPDWLWLWLALSADGDEEGAAQQGRAASTARDARSKQEAQAGA